MNPRIFENNLILSLQNAAQVSGNQPFYAALTAIANEKLNLIDVSSIQSQTSHYGAAVLCQGGVIAVACNLKMAELISEQLNLLLIPQNPEEDVNKAIPDVQSQSQVARDQASETILPDDGSGGSPQL